MICLKPLGIDVVQDEIKQALDVALRFKCAVADSSMCFFPFSDEELRTVRENRPWR